MDNQNSMEVFCKTPVPQAVFKNALPAMAAILMVLVIGIDETIYLSLSNIIKKNGLVKLSNGVMVCCAIG